MNKDILLKAILKDWEKQAIIRKKLKLLESVSFWVMTVRKVKKSYDILYENDLLTKTTHLKYEDMFQDFFTETYKIRYDCYQVLFDLKKYGLDIEDIKF